MKEILLVGNPNSGKTTLFNKLTCSDEHVGNWHGVTVENKQKAFSLGAQDAVLVDTPGIYSLCPLSFEEQVSVETIFSHRHCKILNICDQNNLQRNLYLTTCLLECGLDVVLAINKIDKKSIFEIDEKKLSQKLGIDVVKINAQSGEGLEKLKNCLSRAGSPKMPEYVKSLQLTSMVKCEGFDDNYVKIKLFEKDKKFFKTDDDKFFDNVPKDSVESLCKLRYEFVDKTISTCCKRGTEIYGKSKADKLFLNKFLAFPCFLAILLGIFYLTFFSVGAWLSDGLTWLLSLIFKPILSLIGGAVGTESWIYNLFDCAIFGGIGTVFSFLPQVVILFFCLGIMEDSGYMSRIAFLFEDILGRIGLSGKSIYTLLMGFGCSTTAIMTSRNMEDVNAKRKTALICPYMSCSAKIPIYTVIGGAFFGAKNIFVIAGLYFLGMAISILISFVLNKTILKSKEQSFILEFPPYRATSMKRVGKMLWKNVKSFAIKVGSVMISMNVVIWLLSNFTFSFAYVQTCGGESILQCIGKILAPIFVPLGFGRWAVVASLIAGLVAKEVVVSSIAMFNGVDAASSQLVSNSLLISSSAVYFASGASVLSFLVFCLLYTPCVASISMLLQEVGGKWTAFSIALQLCVAYVCSFVVYNLALACEVFGFFKVIFLLLTLALIAFCVCRIFLSIKKKNACAFCDGCSKSCKKK